MIDCRSADRCLDPFVFIFDRLFLALSLFSSVSCDDNGRQQFRRMIHLFWLMIDRYYSRWIFLHRPYLNDVSMTLEQITVIIDKTMRIGASTRIHPIKTNAGYDWMDNGSSYTLLQEEKNIKSYRTIVKLLLTYVCSRRCVSQAVFSNTCADVSLSYLPVYIDRKILHFDVSSHRFDSVDACRSGEREKKSTEKVYVAVRVGIVYVSDIFSHQWPCQRWSRNHLESWYWTKFSRSSSHLSTVRTTKNHLDWRWQSLRAQWVGGSLHQDSDGENSNAKAGVFTFASLD